MTETMETRKQEQSEATAGSSTANTLLYDRFVERSREIFEQGQEKGHDAWTRAADLAHQQLVAAGEFSAEQGEVFKRFMRRDLDQTAEDMRLLRVEAKEHLHPARLGAGALSSLARLLTATGGALMSISRKAEGALEYETGEITMAGTLTCASCGHKLHLHVTSIVPKCPACEGTRFRKGY